MSQAKPRLHYFDILKGIAIFAVVMGHVLTFCIRGIDTCVTFKLIAQTHMPLFFFISGWMAYKCVDGHEFVAPKMGVKFKQLIIPFVVVSALWILYFPHSGLKTPLVSTFSGLYFDQAKNGYWFTFVLFELFTLYLLLCPILRRCANGAVALGVAAFVWSALIILQQTVPDNIDGLFSIIDLCHFFPIFIIGVFAGKYRSRFWHIVESNVWVTAALVVGGALLYWRMYRYDFPMAENLIIYYLNGPLMHLSLVVVAFRIVKPWSERAFANPDMPSKVALVWSYLGRESLAIYLLHYFFLFPMTPMQGVMRAMNLDFVPTFTFAFVVASVIIVITLGINYIVKQSKPLALLLTGRV